MLSCNVEGWVVNGLARCTWDATLSTACEGDAIEEYDGDLSTSEIESDDSGEISAYRYSDHFFFVFYWFLLFQSCFCCFFTGFYFFKVTFVECVCVRRGLCVLSGACVCVSTRGCVFLGVCLCACVGVCMCVCVCVSLCVYLCGRSLYVCGRLCVFVFVGLFLFLV
jgi:hypothetical protein